MMCICHLVVFSFLSFLLNLYPTTTTAIPINFYTFKVLIDIYIQLISLSTVSLKVVFILIYFQHLIN